MSNLRIAAISCKPQFVKTSLGIIDILFISLCALLYFTIDTQTDPNKAYGNVEENLLILNTSFNMGMYKLLLLDQ